VNTFVLKRGDTLPILEVVLKNPDGSVHDLTGSTDWKLHVKLATGAVVTRTMTKQGADVLGTLRYVWVAADWNAGGLVGNLFDHHMEYEVIAGTNRLTFPNDGYDVLRILPDLA